MLYESKKKEERMLLKYLYMEGYADSYEEAEYLLEELTDEEFEELCENVSTGNARRASFGNIPQRVTASQAAEVRRAAQRKPEPEPQPRAPKTPKGPTTVPSRGVSGGESVLRRRTPEGHRKRGASPVAVAKRRQRILSTGRDPSAATSGGMVRQPTPESKARAKRIGAALRNKANWGTKAEEYVLEYLVQEGYANSYENADVILELMSDEWFEQILND